VPVCGFCVLGCWASASDAVKTIGDTAILNAASPKSEKALRREIVSVSYCSVASKPPYLIVAITVLNTRSTSTCRSAFHFLLFGGLAFKR